MITSRLYQHLFFQAFCFIFFALAISTTRAYSTAISADYKKPLKTDSPFNFDPFYAEFEALFPNKVKPTQEFIEWFVGFSEGDGSWVVKKRGDHSFQIGQSTADVAVLNLIKENLGVGVINADNSCFCQKYSVNDKVGLRLICLIFNGNVVLPTRVQQFQRFLDAVNIRLTSGKIRLEPVASITRVVQPSLNDAWLSGFTDAEGCFYADFNICESGRKRSDTRFSVAQKHDQNKHTLEHIASLFGFGPNTVKAYKDEVYNMRIHGVNNIEAIFEYFDAKPLRSKKQESYVKFKKLQKMTAQNMHLDDATRAEMIILASQVNPGSKGRYKKEITSKIFGRKDLALLK